ncbi:outer membrane receptor protein involved in Fe transport [Sphingobium sp. B1D7B]|uniref:TonB-dependent receptor plug domain-containing protein n=1 Tax=unclassified Sphingobium TaxID=2611147 RepID=UPI00222479A9|nr:MULTISPECIES: TonB-dependent receptor [unclassified Sphingobium]MCW2392921.1 outer membrane receptor protein involved in Fe transport [Sphingobium sp. B11D3A]MCW2404723.1 outer membrane receptor protein involved in Fe transport [Sphingobium sp. B1D7B]
MKKTTSQTLLKLAAAPAVLGLAMLSSAAHAQEPQNADAAEDGEVIVVTGSRIARPELEVANPIVAVTAEAIERTGQINVADVLLRNPALTASIGSSLSGGADSGFGTTGANLLDLRNLGTNRTLVLVNGKRHVAGLPNSAAVDINSIPQDLIEKVDVLTGGSSAVYGADGVSGVVNFVLKRNFEGLTVRGQTGVSSKGDAGSQFISAVAGKNFADDRGNIAVAYEYSNSGRLHSSQRRFTGDPSVYTEILRNQDDIPDNPNVYDRIVYGNLTWADSAPDGAVDLDLDGIPDFTGSGLPYDRGLPLVGGNARAVGGSNTPVAGYFGDLQPQITRHAVNALASYEFAPALRFYAEGKYVKTDSYSVAQPSFDFYTYLQPDNAYLVDRFGPGAAPDGALLSRDNIDFGLRGETVERETVRIVAGFEGELTDNLRYDVSYIFGRTSSRNSQTSNLISDRYFAALDAVRDPVTNNIVCRSTLDPTSDIDPENFGAPASTFTPGANSPCRPLNMLGYGVASREALDFVLADNLSKSRVSQEVISGYISGDTEAVFSLPGGPIGFAIGGEYRRETSRSDPDQMVQNGEFRDFAAIAPSSGSFNVKEVFAELSVPVFSNVPLADTLSFGAAIRYSDYSTIGTTTTWKVDGVYAPIRDIRFRATYSEAVRAPNIGELFRTPSGTFDFVVDPCDVTRLNDGTQYRAANCSAILSGLGLTPGQIAAFSPSTDSQATTSRRGLTGGNRNLQEETARTWTAGVVLQPSFIPGLSLTFDWYDIKIAGAINTPTPTELAELCVDQPTIDNVYCQNIFRDPTSGFVLGDGNDPARRNGFIIGPENVAAFRTAGADFSVNYVFTPGNLGQFRFGLTGGYLDKITFVPTLGADVDDDILERYNPRWRGTLDLSWKLDNVSASYGLTYWSKTRRYTTEQIAANPDLTDPKYFYYRPLFQHDVRVALEVEKRFQLYAGVNNLFDYRPDIGMLSYPISGVGRYLYAGAKITLGPVF